MRPDPVSRRTMLSASAAALGAVAVGAVPAGAGPSPGARRGRLKQSVSRWPYSKIPLPEFARACKAMGLAGIDLLGPDDWAVVRDAGLVPTMGYPTSRNDFIPTGFNDRKNHPMLLTELAEEHGVTICVELLNSKVDHGDYQGDRTAFGTAVTRAVGSPRVKLLYDIYHMQIMEGDVIRTLRDNLSEIAHCHTGGVPGRHELDGTQELNWRAVAMALADAGFTGYVAHEFTPTRDPLTSLRQAVELMTV
jgi:hydroxypyruvate isomerase